MSGEEALRKAGRAVVELRLLKTKVRARMKTRLIRGICILLLSLAGSAAAEQAPPGLARAGELIRNGQYSQAIPVLQQEVGKFPEAGGARHYLMLGECYFMIQRYADAKQWLSRAARYAQGEERVAASYRLAGVAFRLGEYDEAGRQIDLFAKGHPEDERCGKLLVYKMAILSRQGKAAQKELEATHQRVHTNLRRYGATAGLEADELLSHFYQRTGQLDSALELYTRALQARRRMIADAEKEKSSLPSGFYRLHDHAALQAGAICLDKKQATEAIKWLENVRYDAELKTTAKLYMAKVYYDKQEYQRAIDCLTERGFIDSVPAGAVKSDMYLLLGMSEKNRPEGSAARAAEFLSRVAPQARGYCQAQATLGELYRERGLKDDALRAYQASLASTDYAPVALFGLGAIYLDQAQEEKDSAKAKVIYRKAGDALAQLLLKYPLTPQAKDCKEKVEALRAKGIEVAIVTSEEEMVAGWMRTAQDKKGSQEGAQALLSLVRYQIKEVRDEKTKHVLKAPNYRACAAACDRLLDEQAYGGAEFNTQAWNVLKGEVYYNRGVCELASAFPAGQAAGSGAVYLEKADLENAINFLSSAKKLADPKNLELVKQIELGLLEALFKSDKKEHKETAEKRFATLEADYGNDPRFQRLALDLAEWFRQQNRYADAAKAYEGVAERGKDLNEQDVLKAYYLAGAFYSQCAQDADQKAEEKAHVIYIYPKGALQISEDPLKTYAPLLREVAPKWPARPVTAKTALGLLSQASGVPFVWAPGGRGSLAEYLETQNVQLTGKGTAAGFLGQILDLKNHRLDFDLGLTGGTPTLQPRKGEADVDEERAQTLEIFDARQADARFAPLARSYGAWRNVHAGRAPMLLNILDRVQQISGAKVLWAEGVPKDEKLALEFREATGLLPASEYTCAKVLQHILDGIGLRYKVVRRDVSAEWYERAKECFNKLRRIDPKSKWGERALFVLASNYYQQRDYRKMKIILREYLKVFDSPAHEYYHETCFWLGWLLEQDKKYRDACAYYSKAAEECLILYKPEPPDKTPDKEGLRRKLSDDTEFALAVPVSGEFNDYRLAQFVDFIQINTHVTVRLDPALGAGLPPINCPAFKNLPAFEVLYQTLAGLGLSVRGENVDAPAAERAYFRLANVYRKDEQMDLALENCDILLARYPETRRKKDTYALKLEIYKGLKDYANVLRTLEALKQIEGSEIEGYRFDLELAGIHYDLCNYTQAAQLYKNVLGAVREPDEQLSVRESFARSLWRKGDLSEALAQYQQLAREESDPLGRFLNVLMVYYLRVLLGQANETEFPEEAQRFIVLYEKLSDAERQVLKATDLAKATWVYYVTGMIDLKKGRLEDAVKKLAAASNSPDDLLAGEAGFRLGMAYWDARAQGYLEKARESFEYVLFATKTTESAVRATYMLGLCLKEIGKADQAAERFDQILKRYPVSPFAELVRKERGTTP